MLIYENLPFDCFFGLILCDGASRNRYQAKVLRLNLINPGVEYEHSLTEKSKLSINAGYGISMSYPELTFVQKNHAFFFSPFLDVHYKFVYNFDRRNEKGKSVAYNSGDFVGLKFNGRGKNTNTDLIRTDHVDFSVGPTWGFQRSYSRFHFLFNAGPVYYFDTNVYSGIYPIMLELNIGYNVWRNKSR